MPHIFLLIIAIAGQPERIAESCDTYQRCSDDGASMQVEYLAQFQRAPSDFSYRVTTAPKPEPVEVCFYPRDEGSTKCIGDRMEAEDFFAKANWACSYVIYIAWQGHKETVRCRAYDGGVLDYASDANGNFQPIR